MKRVQTTIGSMDRGAEERLEGGRIRGWIVRAHLGWVRRIIHSSRFRQWSNEDHHRFFAELALLHREFQDFGVATYRRTGDTWGKSFTAATRASAVLTARAPSANTEQCLILHGAIRASGTEEICQYLGWPACKFTLKWR